jgi:hypothetical protein
VGHRGSSDAGQNKKICCLCRKYNPKSSVIQPVASRYTDVAIMAKERWNMSVNYILRQSWEENIKTDLKQNRRV